jgi:hypothetical protein
MSSTSSPALTIDVRARRAERVVALGVSALAAFAPWLMTELTAGAASVAAVATGALALWGFRRAGWLGGGRSIARITWTSERRWILEAGSRASEATLTSGTRVGRTVLWLQWRTEGDLRRTLLLAWGDLPDEELRRLVARLRIEGARPAAVLVVAA